MDNNNKRIVSNNPISLDEQDIVTSGRLFAYARFKIKLSTLLIQLLAAAAVVTGGVGVVTGVVVGVVADSFTYCWPGKLTTHTV